MTIGRCQESGPAKKRSAFDGSYRNMRSDGLYSSIVKVYVTGIPNLGTKTPSMISKKKKSTHRKSIGQNFPGSLLSTPSPARRRRASSTSGSPAGKSAARARQKPANSGPKVRATFHLPADLVDECRNAVVWLAGPPERLTMARLAEHALRRELDRLRRKHTEGKAFPQRNNDLRGGRPIGS